MDTTGMREIDFVYEWDDEAADLWHTIKHCEPSDLFVRVMDLIPDTALDEMYGPALWRDIDERDPRAEG
jgi:hypothetical protein